MYVSEINALSLASVNGKQNRLKKCLFQVYLERVDIINIQTHANKVMRSLTSWELHKFPSNFNLSRLLKTFFSHRMEPFHGLSYR